MKMKQEDARLLMVEVVIVEVKEEKKQGRKQADVEAEAPDSHEVSHS